MQTSEYWQVTWLGKGKQRFQTFEYAEDAKRFAARLDTPGVKIRKIRANGIPATR